MGCLYRSSLIRYLRTQASVRGASECGVGSGVTLDRCVAANRPPDIWTPSLTSIEGMHDLKLDQHLATGRDAVASAFVAGSSSLFKAFDGVRTEVSSRLKEREAAAAAAAAASPPPSAVHDAGRRGSHSTLASSDTAISSSTLPVQHISKITSSSSLSTSAASRIPIQAPQIADVRATLGNIGSGIGSFFGSRVASFRAPAVGATTPPAGGVEAVKQNGLRPMSLSGRSLSDRARQGGVDKG